MPSCISTLSPEAMSLNPEEWERRSQQFHEISLDRIDQLVENDPALSDEAFDEATTNIFLENSSLKVKRSKMYRLADTFHQKIADSVACKAGCSFCCSLITYIYEYEAIAMAKASGREMRKIAFRPTQAVMEDAKQYLNKPCPFLVENRCSIYEDRPLICRVHHSFNEDATQCDPSLPVDKVLGMAVLDPDCIEWPYHQLNNVLRPHEPWGAIQEFFPDE